MNERSPNAYHLISIREIRQGLGLRQRELAAWLEIPAAQYSRLERGLEPMMVEQLVATAEKLECRPGELLGP